MPLVAFDCRGCEPVAWHPEDGGFAVKAATGASFDDVDLSEREWTEYDADGGAAVSIMELRHEFRTHRM